MKKCKQKRRVKIRAPASFLFQLRNVKCRQAKRPEIHTTQIPRKRLACKYTRFLPPRLGILRSLPNTHPPASFILLGLAPHSSQNTTKCSSSSTVRHLIILGDGFPLSDVQSRASYAPASHTRSACYQKRLSRLPCHTPNCYGLSSCLYP